MKRSTSIAALAMMLLGSAQIAQAQEGELRAAITAYRAKDYAQARDRFSMLLERRALEVRADRIAARTYLAACHYALGEMDLARSGLRELFTEDPGAPVDPKVFSGIRQTFLELAEEIRAEVAKERGDRPMRPVRSDNPSAPLDLEAPVRHAPPSVAFALIPFGVGQFANDQSTKGALFLTGEGVAFLTAAVALALFESKKVDGHFLQDGRFQQADLNTAYTLQTTYLVAFWGGIAIAAGGIIDAFLNRPEMKINVAVGPGSVYVRF